MNPLRVVLVVSVVAVFSFSCGGSLTYGGRLTEAVTSEGVATRSAGQAEFTVRQNGERLTIDGWEAPLSATVSGSVITVTPGGEVIGGSGFFDGERLSFTILAMVRHPDEIGLASIGFNGKLGAAIDPNAMYDQVSSGAAPSPVEELNMRNALSR